MHYHCEVHVKSLDNIEDQVRELMEPHFEEDSLDGFYDWYQIGGRYSGRHANINPADDPRNHESCFICDGTGYRNDELGKSHREADPSYTCNNCGSYDEESRKWTHGNTPIGVSVKWPTDWVAQECDICRVDEIDSELTCYTLITANGVIHKQDYIDGEFVDTGIGTVIEELKKQGIPDGYLVTVDYHC